MRYVEEAFQTNWLSTVGANLVEFERAVEKWCGLPGVALASGTAAIHLGLKLLGVSAGDEVFCQSLTFSASTNPIRYQAAEPVFIDSERRTWNMDAEVLREALQARAAVGRLPKCVEVVHLFGQCAEMDAILKVCGEYGVPVLEDAAEAMGASYRGRPAGTLGAVGVYSFNGNKLLTTTSGGMLVSQERAWVEKARFWSQQSREPGIAYQHSELGYNYRMSNVLAGIGRGQMEVLDLRVAQRRAIAFRYRDAFADLPGFSLMPEAVDVVSTHWLSVFLVDEEKFGCSRDDLISALNSAEMKIQPI